MGEIRAFVSMSTSPDRLPDVQQAVQVFVDDAVREEGVLGLVYATDESQARILVQEHYVDAAAMLAHLGAMNPTAVSKLGELATIECMDVVGETTVELRDALAGFGAVTYFAPFAST